MPDSTECHNIEFKGANGLKNCKQKYPTIVASWRRAWEQVILFFCVSLDVRRIIYTTNVIESVNMQLRKIINNRGHFPNDEAAAKLIYLTLRNITAKWKMPPVFWKATMSQFAIRYPAAL